MALITLAFDYPINDSVQVGDVVYYCSTNTVGTFNTAQTMIEMGTATIVNVYSLTCNIGNSTPIPPNGSYIMFSKDPRANQTGLKGYYAEVELKNNSTSAVELFTVSSEIGESSK
jgi:hypothetical protein